MAFGLALSVAALLIAVGIPRALGAADDRQAAREPVWGTPAATVTVFEVATSQTATDDGIWTQVRLRGGDANSPVPPGLLQLPAPGHSVLSPALRSLIEQDPRQGIGLGTIDPVEVAPAGLVRPGELVSYTRAESAPSSASSATSAATSAGTSAASSAAPSTPGTGVTSDPSSDLSAGPSTGPATGPSTDPVTAAPGGSVTSFGDPRLSSGLSLALGLEAMVLVALPALLFLSVCARLSVTSRHARLASLRLIGVSLERCARIFSGELALVAAVGAVLGVGAYVAAAPVLASGVLGVKWFASDAAVNPVAAIVCILLSCVLTAALARRSMTRLLRQSETSARPRRWPLCVGGLLTLIGSSFLLIVTVRVFGAAPDDPVLDPSIHIQLVIGACVATMAGLLLALPALLTRVSQWLSTTDLPLSVRLGARQVAHRGSLSSRLLAALVATVMAVGLSSAFLRSTYLDAVGDPTVAVLHADLSGTPADQRRALSAALPDTAVIFLTGEAPDGQQVYIYATTCERYVRLTSEPDTQCRPGAVRVGTDTDPGTLKAGSSITVAQLGTTPVSLTAPRTTIGGISPMTLVIPISDAPWAATSPNPDVTLTVPADDAESVQAALAAAAPAAVIQRVTKDPLSLARYTEQSAILRAALTLAYLLSLLTFIFAMIEARWAGERTMVSQRAIGVPARITRQASLVQAALPVAAGALLVVPATAATGITFLAYWGAGNARDLTFWWPIAALGTAAVLTTAVTGWALGKAPLKLELLAE